MRTTLTLDPDVARMISEEVHRGRKPMKEVVNDALRRGLSSPAGRDRLKAYRVRPHAARLLPGIDRARLNALADEHEDAAILGAAAQPKRKTS
jgi:Arc/MetJ-type ribon-helix-helix transcriptional regulator